MGLSLDALDPPLDDIAYLSRSNNRIAVLRELAESDRSRRELRERIDVSRPTLGRILTGVEDRGWVERGGPGNGHDFSLTPIGRVIVEEFRTLMDRFETAGRLRELAPLIPFEELGLDPRDLAAAAITTPRPTDATAHTRREREFLERSDQVRFLCNQAQPETVERYREWAVREGNAFEAVISGDAIDAAMADARMADALRGMLTTEGVRIHRYEGSMSAILGLYGEVASIVPLDTAGVPRAFIESEAAPVRSAVAAAFERYRASSERVAAPDAAR